MGCAVAVGKRVCAKKQLHAFGPPTFHALSLVEQVLNRLFTTDKNQRLTDQFGFKYITVGFKSSNSEVAITKKTDGFENTGDSTGVWK